MATQTVAAKPAKAAKPKPKAPAGAAPIAEPKAAPATSSPKAMLSAKTAAAAEPPIDRDVANLSAAFRQKLEAVLNQLAAEGIPFKFHEGFRTVDRQQWLFGSGRPHVKPYGRGGDVVTHKDGVKDLSNHQGNGTAGSGNAADCYPMAGGKIIWPPPPMTDPRWKRYADLAVAQGLDAGFYWKKFKDLPHIELKS